MILTKEQIRNIHNLKSDILIEIMHECAEALGVVSIDDYCNIIGEKRRTVYDKINDGRIKYVKIIRKYPFINT